MDIKKWLRQGTTAASNQSGGEGEKPTAEPTRIAKAVEPSSKGTCATVFQPGDIGGNQPNNCSLQDRT